MTTPNRRKTVQSAKPDANRRSATQSTHTDARTFPVEIETIPGDDISVVLKEAIAMAPAFFMFNGVRMDVQPGDTLAERHAYYRRRLGNDNVVNMAEDRLEFLKETGR